jgi:RNA polymerase sigma factor (TIGR02999 family)
VIATAQLAPAPSITVGCRRFRANERNVPVGSISSLIAAAERGDSLSHEALFTALYRELHRLAGRELARRGGPPSLGVTTLLHEAYLDIARRGGASFPDRGRFMGYAARVMRGLILNHVRARRAQKRGDRFEITSVQGDVMELPDERELASISDALDELAKVDPALAQLVDLKFFCGFSFAEIAAMRATSERTVQRHWEKARLYLNRAIRPS